MKTEDREMRRAVGFGLLTAVVLGLSLALHLSGGTGHSGQSKNRSVWGRLGNTSQLPLVWYSGSGLWAYEPRSQRKLILTEGSRGGTDRLTETDTNQNPADFCKFTKDGSRVYYLKGLTTCGSGSAERKICGDLYGRDLSSGGKARKERLFSEKVSRYDILSDGQLICLSSNGDLCRIGWKGEREIILPGIRAYWISEDKERLFFVSQSGKGYRYETANRRRDQIVDGVGEVAFTAADLSGIYYFTESQDLFFIDGLERARIVDVDVQTLSVVAGTGHAYYLKKAGGELIPAPDPGAAPSTSPKGRPLQGTGDAASGGTSEHTMTLSYFDGACSLDVLPGVSYLETRFAEVLKRDRILACLGMSGQYRVYLVREGTALDTGLSLTDETVKDVCLNGTDDLFYFVREEKKGEGQVFSRQYTESGLGEEHSQGIRADLVIAAGAERLFTGRFSKDPSVIDFSVNGREIAKQVSGYYWDESGAKKEMYFYRNVFQSGYYTSGELDFWSGEEGEAVVPLAYNVKEYHVFPDSAATILTEYDEEMGKGTLLYWMGSGDVKRIAEDAVGTKHGLGEGDRE